MLLVTGIGQATIGPPVAVRLTDVSGPATTGEIFTATLEIEAGSRLILTDLYWEGRGWDLTGFRSPSTLELDAGETTSLPLVAIPADVAAPLRIHFRVNGSQFMRSYDLSPAAFAAARYGYEATAIPGSVISTPPTGWTESTLLAPLPPKDPEYTKPEQPGDKAGWDREQSDTPPLARVQEAYEIEVFGQFAYYRPDTSLAFGAYGVTVRVYDQDTGPDELLGQTLTDEDGYFYVSCTWDPCYLCDQTPDLYVKFEAANTHFEVQEPGFFEVNYSWHSATFHDYTGTVLNIGGQSPSNPDHFPGLHILATLSRGWNFIYDESGYETPDIDVIWPNEGAPYTYYSRSEEQIYVRPSEQWSEPACLHEYGHHWDNMYVQDRDLDYCNGVCDPDPPDVCSHCNMCPENGEVAYTEGFAEWFEDRMSQRLRELHGLKIHYVVSYENIWTCSQLGGIVGDPNLTEGIFAAFLVDVTDSTPDDHPLFPGVKDTLEFPFATILSFTDSFEPVTPAAYVQQFFDFYNGWQPEIWETAANCGYQLDSTPPDTVPDLSSPSHLAGVPSADSSPEFTWSHAPDDVSGIAGYSFNLTIGSPWAPDTSQDLDAVNSYLVDLLPPGNYWFTLRAVDRAGYWSPDYATYGPVVIRDAVPANLTYVHSFDWERPLIPRPTADADPGVTYLDDPDYLLPEHTYLNMFAANVGEAGTGVGPAASYFIDEELITPLQWGVIPPFGDMSIANMGPLFLPSGRHVLHSWLDSYEVVPETNETDNLEGHQWVWTPEELTVAVPAARNAPAERLAGWDAVVDGQELWYDCDGFRYTPSGWWQVLVLHPLDITADFDLRLHDVSTGASDGFTTYQVGSALLAGHTDAVVVNGNQVAWQTRDVGVINWNGDGSDYELTYVNSIYVTLNVSEVVSLAHDEMLFAREIYLDPGYYTVTTQVDNPALPVRIGWFDMSFLMGGIASSTGYAVADSNGTARLDVEANTTGWYGIMVYRHGSDGNAPVSVTLQVEATPPELYPVQLAGWYAPLVPWPTTGAQPNAVAMPASLTGDATTTYFNLAITNESPAAAAPAARIYLDGDDIIAGTVTYPAFTGDFTQLDLPSAVSISGGRHSLWTWIDYEDLIVEGTELNNVYGEQWIWSPAEMPLDFPVIRESPPHRIGGLDGMTTAEPFYYVCDGVRTPVFVPGTPQPTDTWWVAIALQPGAASDLDLRLHPPSTGPKDGFAGYLATSVWGVEETDFVLANFHLATAQQFDVGVTKHQGGPDGYLLHTIRSVYAGGAPCDPLGPLGLPAWYVLLVYEFTFPIGTWEVRLHDLGGGVDWGVSLQRNDLAYLSKSDVLPEGIAWLAGAGQSEVFQVEVEEAGDYCLAVWKVGLADLVLDGTFALEILSVATGVPGAEVPAPSFALAQNSPNPFNPRTVIAFELPAAQPFSVTIHDAAGRRIRQLDGKGVVGRNQVVWDGMNDAGAAAAAGVYLYTLQSGEQSLTRKMVLIR
jgi:hypothetical protein